MPEFFFVLASDTFYAQYRHINNCIKKFDVMQLIFDKNGSFLNSALFSRFAFSYWSFIIEHSPAGV